MFNFQFKRNSNTFLFLIINPIAIGFLFLILLASCSIQKQLSKSATQLVLKDSSLLTAHVGISIYEPAANKYWYNYQGDKYFTPASNTKLPTCYAAMKYLGDSLVGLRYQDQDNQLIIQGAGDPTFLNREFQVQRVFEFLKKAQKPIVWDYYNWRDEYLGSGWSWNDYNDDYMAGRSALPLFGNVLELFGKRADLHITPPIIFSYQYEGGNDLYLSNVLREKESNRFSFEFKGETKRILHVPFLTMNGEVNKKILSDTLHKKIIPQDDFIPATAGDRDVTVIHSQPTDSLLKPMMHRSDNFFAEQSLLMVSNERLGVMNDEKIIDTLLKTDFKDLPQKPRWVDGSGLSRYNLFTPQDFVSILTKIKKEFGMGRIKNIL
ncbi:MAG TPA: D-alanyl-D-alanine carboxypeptidase, partial [Chitinophagaceae bacterium]|nr:D-alanyl-D-alanine carboxypeptidase [Chitinophagaceae bacterium]